jgi:hypothetical protein
MLPGILAAAYGLLDLNQRLGDRLLSAIFLGVALPVVGYSAIAFATIAADHLLGEDHEIHELALRHVLAGMLLVTVAWVWMQYSRNRTVDGIAYCVQTMAEQEQLSPRQLRAAVLACHKQPADDPFDE